jgi:hypothetical protein
LIKAMIFWYQENKINDINVFFFTFSLFNFQKFSNILKFLLLLGLLFTETSTLIWKPSFCWKKNNQFASMVLNFLWRMLHSQSQKKTYFFWMYDISMERITIIIILFF